MKKLCIAIFILCSLLSLDAQTYGEYFRFGKMTTADKLAIDVSDTSVVYEVFDTDLQELQINYGLGWVCISCSASGSTQNLDQTLALGSESTRNIFLTNGGLFRSYFLGSSGTTYTEIDGRRFYATSASGYGELGVGYVNAVSASNNNFIGINASDGRINVRGGFGSTSYIQIENYTGEHVWRMPLTSTRLLGFSNMDDDETFSSPLVTTIPTTRAVKALFDNVSTSTPDLDQVTAVDSTTSHRVYFNAGLNATQGTFGSTVIDDAQFNNAKGLSSVVGTSEFLIYSNFLGANVPIRYSGVSNGALTDNDLAPKSYVDANSGTDLKIYKDASEIPLQSNLDVLLKFNNSFNVTDSGNNNIEIDLTSTIKNQLASIPTVIDDDTFATATSTNVASAESIKAYIDSNSGATQISYNNVTADFTIGANQLFDDGVIHRYEASNDSIVATIPNDTILGISATDNVFIALKRQGSGKMQTDYASGVTGEYAKHVADSTQKVIYLAHIGANAWEVHSGAFEYYTIASPSVVPSFVSGAGAESATNSIAFSGLTPTTGNVLFASISVQESVNFNTPAGWTLISEIDGVYSTFALLYKISDGTETAPTFTNDGAGGQTMYGQIIEFTGVNTTTPYTSLATTGEVTTNPLAINALTSTTANSLAVSFVQFQRGSGTFDSITTAPTNYVERYSSWTNSGGDAWHLCYTQDVATAVAISADSISFANQENLVSFNLVLNPE